MLSQVLEMVFVIAGMIVALLFCVRVRRLTERDRGAAVAAAFGLFLCGRYSALIDGAANFTFAVGVAFLMALLAYQSLNFRSEPQIEPR